jgi:hypothetical protein
LVLHVHQNVFVRRLQYHPVRHLDSSAEVNK